ncbi:MAG: hypothetical protein FRX48_01443 [Lasallia pustulata]|uniref:Uncharacterized protein n=1 Tax=Lasallia pustulata TaxID=136370 RepID=A0A5M8PY99_9LECA|nr:MAG: hypothetical protein FRX48_01443 [Lasallia pustulata]
MAYPFPRIALTPQTPQYVQGIESPRNKMARRPQPGWIGGYKSTAILAAFVVAVLLWLVNSSSLRSRKQADRIPISPSHAKDYFARFEGHQDCGLLSPDLYIPPAQHEHDRRGHPYCPNRATLLEAMSGGGRHGFDAPFFPADCHYRWYSTDEICMILDRFDTVVFIGDSVLQHIYAAFNMLLRENIGMGGLKQWEMKESERSICRCDNQLMKSECSNHAVLHSQEVIDNDGGSSHRSPYHCDRTPHVLLPISGSPAPESLHNTFTSIISRDPDSYKPIPVILSVSLSTSLSWPAATASMDEWLALADTSRRNMPFLWVGPNAAGHLKPPGQILSQGNNALWHYTVEQLKEAKTRDMDALGMYNLTLQAASWDGSSYGQKVALVQAMMIINWLSRVDST